MERVKGLSAHLQMPFQRRDIGHTVCVRVLTPDVSHTECVRLLATHDSSTGRERVLTSDVSHTECVQALATHNSNTGRVQVLTPHDKEIMKLEKLLGLGEGVIPSQRPA